MNLSVILTGCALGAVLWLWSMFVWRAGQRYGYRTLHADLGKLKWMGSDDGWCLAIEAVRKEIAKRIAREAAHEQ